MSEMRIVLRKAKGQLYLQPSGEFTADRNSARCFETSVIAWCWAKEQELLGLDMVMAFEDERFDIVSMRT